MTKEINIIKKHNLFSVYISEHCNVNKILKYVNKILSKFYHIYSRNKVRRPLQKRLLLVANFHIKNQSYSFWYTTGLQNKNY